MPIMISAEEVWSFTTIFCTPLLHSSSNADAGGLESEPKNIISTLSSLESRMKMLGMKNQEMKKTTYRTIKNQWSNCEDEHEEIYFHSSSRKFHPHAHCRNWKRFIFRIRLVGIPVLDSWAISSSLFSSLFEISVTLLKLVESSSSLFAEIAKILPSSWVITKSEVWHD